MRTHGAPARLSIVYPSLGNVFYHQLAVRLFDAASELDVDTRLIGSSSLDLVESSWASSAPAFIVSPNECFLSGSEKMRILEDAPFRAAVLADCVGTPWYRKTFSLDMEFDLVVDVGFLDQSALRPFKAVPYRLLPNAPLPREAESIREAQPGSRSINWALIGHATPDRLLLAEQLLRFLGAEGFLFLPQLRPVRPAEGMLSPAALDRVLQAANLYVWCSHHTQPYYESFRFLDAVICGSVPCKIDTATSAELRGLPNVFCSVKDLARAAVDRSPKGLFESSRDYALSIGMLTDRFADLLGDCLAFTR
jgi:hypothetical protein